MTDLIQKYGLLRFNNGPLSAKYTYATAKAKYGAFFAWVEGLGIPQALIMTINEVAAAWNNEVWEGDGYAVPNQGPYPANGCQSRVNINAEQLCHAKINIPLLVCFGRYIGGGSGNYTETTTANGGPGSTDGTCIEIDHAGWLSQYFPERFCLMTTTWNNDTILGYSESFIIDGFRLEGGKAGTVHDPSYISAGIGTWDTGETSEVRNVYAIGFNSYGFMNVRGTPSTFNTCSPFSNGIFGFGLIGCDLSTITLSSPSGDDNGALIGIRAGYGRPGGATLTVVGAKNESGKRQPYRKQKFIDAQGACNIIVCGAWVHAIDNPECVIAVDFQTYPGGLDVSGLRYDGYPLSLKLTSNGVTKTYSGPGGMLPISFVATEAGVVSSSRSMGGSAPPPPPVDPPPPPPPPTGGILYTRPVPVTVAANTSIAVNIAGVTKVDLSFTPSTAPNYGRIIGTGPNLPSLMVQPDGYFWWGTTAGGWTKCATTNPAKVTNGVKWTGVITLPSAQTVKCIHQTDPGQGGAYKGYFEKLNLL